ncbi:hypothetical protein Ciccas_002071 [Cichlidogyrus casuarinus]|uniref:Uncharacterized protein n=1 Tax=Cichlidogyrus casuarinus TaxID=1844966 RepID=A0ABD2QIC2_9PLAT
MILRLQLKELEEQGKKNEDSPEVKRIKQIINVERNENRPLEVILEEAFGDGEFQQSDLEFISSSLVVGLVASSSHID